MHLVSHRGGVPAQAAGQHAGGRRADPGQRHRDQTKSAQLDSIRVSMTTSCLIRPSSTLNDGDDQGKAEKGRAAEEEAE